MPGTRSMKATPLPVSIALAGHVRRLAPERDRDLETRAREQRDEDLRDREVEAERDLAEHLQRDDDGGEVQPRIAEPGRSTG